MQEPKAIWQVVIFTVVLTFGYVLWIHLILTGEILWLAHLGVVEDAVYGTWWLLLWLPIRWLVIFNFYAFSAIMAVIVAVQIFWKVGFRLVQLLRH